MGFILLRPGCSCKCVFCNPPSPKELRFSKKYQKNIKTALLNVENFIRKQEQSIIISGNDPIEDPKTLIMLLEKLYYNIPGVAITLASHSVPLKNPNLVKTLARSGVKRLAIPIYGSTTDIHSTIIQHTGKFLHSQLDAIKNFLEHDINVEIRIGITKTNYTDLINIIKKIFSITYSKRSLIEYKFSIIYLPKANSSTNNYIPICNLKNKLDYLIDFLDGHIEINSKIIGFPFCIFNKPRRSYMYNNEDFLYKLKEEHAFNMGIQTYNSEVQSTIDSRIPSYRIRVQPLFCNDCIYNTICAGIPKYDYDLYGSGELQPWSYRKINN